MTLEVQFLSMLASVGTGLWFGASFDTYKRFVGGSKRFRWTLLINDILFWLLQALVFFYVLFQVNQGEIRFYLFLALILGYSIYRALLERIYLKILNWVIRFVKQTIHILVQTTKVLIINPIKWLLKVTVALSMIVLTTIWRILHILLQVLLFPFRWLIQKFVQAFGNPLDRVVAKLVNWKRKIINLWNKVRNKFR
ncbi:spore cortex biosynthesis protein YabQ [Evansella vedderi]|uniref:Spore cortex biosynthesis protein YabQ n=1 Tax=Evansella vedderi TaxID=38282 RepID=A0ABU0A306_9BACI|nr:spore cortex biosynthesis protein YabQ [Evansella vedderi]MDQ0257871.1 spore cortex biosynthesis protein YabQ [Evansella vedderi]